jgi:hypothetical protein
VATNDKTKIRFDSENFFDKKLPNSNFLGWSLAVSDIIDNNIGFVAISCITDKEMNSKKVEEVNYSYLIKQFSIIYNKSTASPRRIVNYLMYNIIILLIKSPLLSFLWFIFIPFYILYLNESFHSKISKKDKRFRLLSSSSKGMIRVYKFSFNNDNDDNDDNDDNIDISLYKYHFGGVVSFISSSKNSKNSLKDNVTLICMNCINIQKFNIKLNKKISVTKENTYLLPENLFKKLESSDNPKYNWKYLLKSRYKEFLMVDTSDYQQTQSIEIYDINTSKLVNVFYRRRGEKDFIISRNNEPGIFAITTDSRLFAYSYGDNVITIYLIENGLEVVSKKFDNIYKIKFLEFIEEDKKLFIIEEDKESDVKFHIWLISGCLNDYFPIPKDDIKFSNDEFSTLMKYDDYYYNLTKANGKIIILINNDEKKYEDRFRVLSEIKIKRITFGENDTIIDKNEHEFSNCDELEPWNANNEKIIRGRFLNNDKRFLLIIGQKSIQLWKSKSQNYRNYEDFKNFENSNLVYILIHDYISETVSRLQIEDDMTTIITHACKSLAYLYKHTDSINAKEKNQKFVSGTINIINDFIKNYPDNWKLMEVQYPLMAYLIYSRSFSLIKYILFENGEKLHRPQHKYGSYPCYDDLELCDDLGFDIELNDNDLGIDIGLKDNDLRFDKDNELGFDIRLKYNDLGFDKGLKNNDLRSVNDLELALKFCKG